MSQNPALLQVQYRDGTNLNARIALHARFSAAAGDFHDWLFDHIALPPAARVLELGCGTGLLWSKVHRRVQPGWQLTLTDLSGGMLAATRAVFADLESAALRHAAYVRSDTQSIPFPSESFDAVLANHMLYHVPDIPRALAEVRRVLKRGGRLYAATNGDGHLAELAQLTVESGIAQVAPWSMTHTTAFCLENGTALLAPCFAYVTRDDFADSLAVTEVEPLVAYVLSMNANLGRVDAAREDRLRAVIAQRIARDGAIHIAKSSGLFVAEARKP